MDLYTKVMERFHWTCTWLDCWLPAEEMHEEPPRSLKPIHEDTMHPVCHYHGKLSHAKRALAQNMLRDGRAAVLDFYSEG